MRLCSACVILAIVVAGCTTTGTDTESAGSTSTAPVASTSIIPGFPQVYPGPPATVAIGFQGTLQIDTDSLCVTLKEDEDHIRVLAFSEALEPSIDLSDLESPALIMNGCRPLRDGDYVLFYGAGSFTDREAAEAYLDLAGLQRCGTTVEEVTLVGYCDGPSRP